MPHMQRIRTGSPEIERPTCELCGSQMWLRKVAKDGADTEARVFECPVCEVSADASDQQQS